MWGPCFLPDISGRNANGADGIPDLGKETPARK